MGGKHLLILFISACLVWLLSCANPVIPTGGPDDKRPPIWLKSNPDTFATNIRSGSITLTFDEWIDLKNADREIQISPPQNHSPIITVRGKSVILTLQDSLKPNTTYQINFGSAIRDITEANIATPLRLVFSTGPNIDSAWMERVLLDAQTGKPISNAVLLAFTQKYQYEGPGPAPDYLAHADSLGRARLQYLPTSPLNLIGLKEASPDYRYNRPGAEWLGFEQQASSPFSIDTLWLFKEEPDSLFFTSVKEAHAGKWVFKLSRPTLECSLLAPQNGQMEFVLQKQSGFMDSFTVWMADFNRTDSIDFQFLADGKTLSRRIYPTARPRPPRMGLPALSSPKNNLWVLHHERPILNFNPQGLFTLQGNDTLPAKANLTEGVLTLELNEKGNSPTRVIWDSAAIFDVFSMPLPAGNLPVEAANFVDWTVDLGAHQTSKNILVWAQKEGKPESKVEFSIQDGGQKATARLPIGKYMLFKTLDTNMDGRWTPGKWRDQIPPETTRTTPHIFELKPGFDLQTSWE